MTKQGLKFIEEFEMTIYYDDIPIGKRRVDFFVEQKIMVELKAISDLKKRDITQALNYLEASKNEVGLLLNFGSISFQFHRLQLKPSKLRNQSNQ